MNVSDRLRLVLDALGLKITEAAKRSGIPYRSWQNYLSGAREPGADALASICTHLNVSADWLLTGVGDMLKSGGAPGMAAENQREEAVLALFRQLSEGEQREIQQVAEEKKRLREVERKLEEVSAALAAGRRAS